MGFGERLQREREMRGITLEEISASTKIGTRSLRALEKEDFDQLPGGVFNKGFVRAYAKYLGIDEEQAVADYLTAAGEQEMPLPQAVPKPETQVVITRKSNSRIWVMVALLALVAGGSATYKYRPDLLGMAAPDAEESIAPTRDIAEEAENEESTAPGSTGVTEASAAAPDAGLPAASQTPLAAAPETSSSSAGFTLRLNARQDSWVSVTVDGKPAMTGTLSGERTFQAQREVKMTVGNAGAVEVSQNGRTLPPLGAENQARTVTITAEGIQR